MCTKRKVQLELDREEILTQINSEEREIVAKFAEDPKLGKNPAKDQENCRNLLAILAGPTEVYWHRCYLGATVRMAHPSSFLVEEITRRPADFAHGPVTCQNEELAHVCHAASPLVALTSHIVEEVFSAHIQSRSVPPTPQWTIYPFVERTGALLRKKRMQISCSHPRSNPPPAASMHMPPPPPSLVDHQGLWMTFQETKMSNRSLPWMMPALYPPYPPRSISNHHSIGWLHPAKNHLLPSDPWSSQLRLESFP